MVIFHSYVKFPEGKTCLKLLKKKPAVDFLPFSALFHLPIPPSPWAPHDLQLPALFVVRHPWTCPASPVAPHIVPGKSSFAAPVAIPPGWPAGNLSHVGPWLNCGDAADPINEFLKSVVQHFPQYAFIFSNLCEDVPVLTEARPWLKNYRDPIPTPKPQIFKPSGLLGIGSPCLQALILSCQGNLPDNDVLYGDFTVVLWYFMVILWYLMVILQLFHGTLWRFYSEFMMIWWAWPTKNKRTCWIVWGYTDAQWSWIGDFSIFLVASKWL